MAVFLAATFAYNRTKENGAFGGRIIDDVVNEDEARGKAMRELVAEHPVKDGWSGHFVVLNELFAETLVVLVPQARNKEPEKPPTGG